jgi:hypothetical protein
MGSRLFTIVRMGTPHFSPQIYRAPECRQLFFTHTNAKHRLPTNTNRTFSKNLWCDVMRCDTSTCKYDSLPSHGLCWSLYRYHIPLAFFDIRHLGHIQTCLDVIRSNPRGPSYIYAYHHHALITIELLHGYNAVRALQEAGSAIRH